MKLIKKASLFSFFIYPASHLAPQKAQTFDLSPFLSETYALQQRPTFLVPESENKNPLLISFDRPVKVILNIKSLSNSSHFYNYHGSDLTMSRL